MLSLVSRLADRLLRLPELRNFSSTDFDSVNAAQLERRIFAGKPILRHLYDVYCRPMVESARRAGPGARMLEIGSGTSPLKDFIPEVITSDVAHFPWVDLTASAYSLPFPDASLDRIFLLFVCHHLGRFEDFLGEARRCLKPGGEMVIVDPAITAFSRRYYKLHVDRMDLETEQWGFQGEGRLSDSNIALAWIAFFRDRERFEHRYPEFSIKNVEYNTTLSFLLTGGLRIRQLLPQFILKVLFAGENWCIKHLTKELAVTMAVTLTRRELP